MERLLHEHELVAEVPCSAQELCGTLVQHFVRLTDPMRKVLENPDYYGRRLTGKERKQRDSMIIENMGKVPGKLDHATVVAYEVGNYYGEGDKEDLSVLSPVLETTAKSLRSLQLHRTWSHPLRKVRQYQVNTFVMSLPSDD